MAGNKKYFVIEDGVLTEYSGKGGNVVIPAGVTEIDDSAFYGCSNIKSVTIPEGVTKISDEAFSCCKSLTSVTIPKSVTEIGEYAFCNCSKLTSLTIPEGVTEIAEYTFYDCSKLTSVTIPESVTIIGKCAFDGCSSLANVTVPEGVTEIGDSAFSDCGKLISMTIPESVTIIGKCAFDGCSSLADVNVPEGVTKIGSQTFCGCKSLINVTIPEGVTEIGEYAFSDCGKLISVTIPESVTEIGEYAFSDCDKLISVTIPESVTEIGDGAFAGTPFLTGICNENGLSVINGILLKYSGKESAVEIPKSVTKIGHNAFSECKKLKSVIIPESVTAIGDSGFYGCSKLTNVTIPKSVTKIGRKAFYDCESLTSVTIPEGLTEIGYSTFWNCSSFTNVTIPVSVTKIGDYAFYECSSLTNVTVPEGVTEIGERAFRSCSKLTSVTVPESVTKIGELAFSECDNLAEIKNYDKYIIRGGEVKNDDIIEIIKTLSKNGSVSIAAAAYLITTSKSVIKSCRYEMDKQPAQSLAAIADILGNTKATNAAYKKAAEFALDFSDKVNSDDIKRIYDAMCANKAAKTAELLKPYIGADGKKKNDKTYSDPTEKMCRELYSEQVVNKLLRSFSAPAVKYKNGSDAPEFVVKCIFYAYAVQLEERPKRIGGYMTDYSGFKFVPEADKIAENLDPNSLHALIDSYADTLSTNDIFLFAPLCRYADSAQISTIAAHMSKWKDWNRYSSAGRSSIIVMRGALLLNDTREAMMRADKAKLLDAYAEMRGTTAQYLRDTVMIDFGLDENGEKLYDLGGTTVMAYMEKDLSVALFDVTNNKAVKSLPKKNADTEKYEKCSADLKDIKKNIKKAISERAKRLRQEFLTGSGMPAADWKKVYMDNAVMRRLAVTLVWRISGKKTGFMPTESGGLVLSDGSAFTLPESGSVCLAHPMDFSAAETKKWKDHLSDNSISQAFTQMYEPIYDLSGDGIIKYYEGVKIPLSRLRELGREGITINEITEESALFLALDGNALSANILPDENGIHWWARNGIFSINSLSADTPVTLSDFCIRKDAGKKQLNHDVYVLDNLFIEAAVRGGRIESLTAFANCITEKNIDRLIEAAQSEKQTECLAWLINYKNEHFGFSFPDLVLE